ncbi:hypothetical protein AB4851_28765 [Burkholderia sp. 22PA0099]|uniref:hypothetical protein n=1 Tax=Burkholderia sp. 22PA0099 TaxID=3237372 RepID=UPI0039C1BF37
MFDSKSKLYPLIPPGPALQAATAKSKKLAKGGQTCNDAKLKAFRQVMHSDTTTC